jgi:hypothetical protein
VSEELDDMLRQALSEVSNSEEKQKQYPELADLLRSTKRRLDERGIERETRLDDQATEKLCKVGEQILESLDMVSKAARDVLSGRSKEPVEIVPLGDTNPMVGVRRGAQNLSAIRTGVGTDLERILREPFVARLVVEWLDSEPGSATTLYVSRASAAGVPSVIADAQLVTYAAPLGRLAEFDAGDVTSVFLGRRKREAHIVERVLIRPDRLDGEWDALDDSFDFFTWRAALDSIRRFLREVGREPGGLTEELDLLGPLLRADATLRLMRQTARRKAIERMALRDQPILDRYQGEIFRMALDHQLLLLGAPGTGKTTTLIKRLAQKRTPGGLTEEEEELLSGGLREAFLRSDSWAMYSPTELLKLYLRDSFNKEGVPAADTRNLRTWDKERLDLGRNVLRILRSADSGGFQLDEQSTVLSDTSSPTLSRLYDKVSAEVDAVVLKECGDALTALGNSEDESIRALAKRLRRRLGAEESLSVSALQGLLVPSIDLQSEARQLNAKIDEDLRRIVNQLIRRDPELIDELSQALPQLLVQHDEDDDDEAEDEAAEDRAAAKTISDRRAQAAGILMSAVRVRARAAAEGRARPGGTSGRVIEFLGERLPTNDDLSVVGKRLVTLRLLRTVIRSPRSLVLGASRIYSRFRRVSLKEGSEFFRRETDAVDKSLISPDEVDILILVMLRNARYLLQPRPGERIESFTSPDWLESIKSRYLMQVFVDEATDFSAVQLACMLELSYPAVRSWFACGDWRQRVTRNGLKDPSELEWLARVTGVKIDAREINIGYRQSRKLRELAEALAALDNEPESDTEASAAVEEAQASPVLGENLSYDSLAVWLKDRILEVEHAVGRLPSVAVFVDSEERVDSLVEGVEPLLASHNLKIVACKDGRVVGDAQEVRVFDIRHIKGLEFEAVFFVGIDRLAKHLPDLFHRLLYVGVTRAATFLGVTCEGVLPERLERLRDHFVEGGW